jgi:hypothetical protein
MDLINLGNRFQEKICIELHFPIGKLQYYNYHNWIANYEETTRNFGACTIKLFTTLIYGFP